MKKSASLDKLMRNLSRGSKMKASSFDILIPKISDEIIDCQISQWVKNEGDYVLEGEVIVELETEKTIIQIESPCEGILNSIFVFEGEEVIDGERIGIINSAELYDEMLEDEDYIDPELALLEEELEENEEDEEEEEDEELEDYDEEEEESFDSSFFDDDESN